VATNPDRASYFPAIEKKFGMPMSHWFDEMEKIKDLKYPEQIAYLRENHGFSQAHANALVLYSKGNTTSRRFNTMDEYLAEATDEQSDTVHAIFKVLTSKYKKSKVVIAWNHPMLMQGDQYLFGVNTLKNYILISPLSGDVIAAFQDRLRADGYRVNKKTIQVPSNWKPDATLLREMVDARIVELNGD
jgi:uncharacterized protein YdhG (YjbR/CyaY superfamily)